MLSGSQAGVRALAMLSLYMGARPNMHHPSSQRNLQSHWETETGVHRCQLGRELNGAPQTAPVFKPKGKKTSFHCMAEQHHQFIIVLK